MLKIVKSKRWMYAADTLIVISTIGAVSFGIVQRFSKVDDNSCKTAGTNHQLQLQNGAFSKTALTVKRCDTITVVDLDSAEYFLNFGRHDKLVDYPGFEPQLLANNESLTIDALTAGTYKLHDHLRNKAEVTLKVEPLN